MQPELIIIFASSIIYFALGIQYTAMLKRNWQAFNTASNKHPTLHALMLITWLAMFVIFALWKWTEPVLQMLNASRKNDWPETEKEQDEYL